MAHPRRRLMLDELKDGPKELIKERPKDLGKDRPKELFKERPKELIKDRKEVFEKPRGENKLGENKFGDNLPGQAFDVMSGAGTAGDASLEERLAALEAAVQALLAAVAGEPDGGQWPAAGEPFIGAAERPQLGVDLGQPDLAHLRAQMESGSAQAKQVYDNLPPG